MADCFIIRRGSIQNESTLMPFRNGIVGYFDTTSVDISNNRWNNLLSGNHFVLPNGGAINNNALYLTSEQYGEFQMENEPQTFYCVFKVITPSNDWTPIISKMTTIESNYSALCLSCNPSNAISTIVQGKELVSSTLANEYHVVCISRNSNTVYFYIDGISAGTITSNNGYYGGYCYLNRYYRDGFMHTPTDVEFKMCAIGDSYHSSSIVSGNTMFLLKKFL